MRKRTTDEVLSGLRNRKRLLNAADLGSRGLFYGGMAALAAVVAAAAWGSTAAIERPWMMLAVMPLGGLAGAIAGLLRPLDSLFLARAMDRAAGSQDRLASALQLAGHHRWERVELITRDALERVARCDLAAALPLRYPGELKWLPVVIALVSAVLWAWPGQRLVASDSGAPEVTADEWQELERLLRRRIEREFEIPRSEQQREIAEQLKQLASSLSKQPDKKDVLAEIARTRAALGERRARLRTSNLNMKQAASALRSSPMLKELETLLKQGDYRGAARMLAALSEALKLKRLTPSADELESVAADLERLARELTPLKELSDACRQCAAAAGSLNQDELAKSLKELAEQLSKNASELEENDALCKACSALEELERRLAETSNKRCSVCQGHNSAHCQACQGGPRAGQRFVKYGAKKGGLKAGRGTQRNWKGGGLAEGEVQRQPVLLPEKELGGPLTTVAQTISKEERAASALEYRQKFSELVRKAEADLELDDVPLAYREFLRRYFTAIKPKDEPAESAPDPR